MKKNETKKQLTKFSLTLFSQLDLIITEFVVRSLLSPSSLLKF